jgi:uncharacterized protein (DUF1684 family)
MRGRRSTGLPLVAAIALVAAAPSAKDYRQTIETWRRERETRLKAPEGWLAVAGLFWLREGPNRFGTDRANDVVLPAKSAPARAGVITLASGRTSLRLEPGVVATVDGHPVTERDLRPDTTGKPDVLRLGRLRLSVIERGGRHGLRLWDPDNPRRRAFTGLRWYPVDEAYRVTARFVPGPPGRTISIANVLGQVEEMPSPGHVEFTLRGERLRLEPVLEQGSPELFFIFRDRTAGKQTYAAGRFLYADPPRDGVVVLDFNKAYSPPCAYTDFATCPLPPKQNRLPVAIAAGERKPLGHENKAPGHSPQPAAPTRSKPSTGQSATRARVASSVRSSWSGVTETRRSRSTALQSLPGMSSCWYSLPPIQ